MRGQDSTAPYEADYYDDETQSSRSLTYPASSQSDASLVRIPYGSSFFKAVRTAQGSPLDGCGAHAKIITCFSNEAHKKGRRFIKNCCHRYVCPTCYESTIDRAADEVDERLNELARIWRIEGKDLRTPHHWEFSPDDQEGWSRERIEADGGRALWQAFSAVLKKVVPYYYVDKNGQKIDYEHYKSLDRYERRRVAEHRGPFKRVNFDYGVVAVFHGEREKFFYDGQWVSKVDVPEDVDTTKLLFDWVWGPHFHVIGFGFWINSASFNEKAQWAYKKIPEKEGQERIIRDTVKYQLSHATIIMQKRCDHHGRETERQYGQAYHYYGLMANAKGGFVEEVEEVEEKCEECAKEGVESYMHEFHIITVGDEELVDRHSDLGVHIKRVITRHWYVNKFRKKKRKADLQAYDDWTSTTRKEEK